MSDLSSAAGPLVYGIPLALWIAGGVGLLSPFIAWRSNANSRKNLDKQLAHDSEQLERRLEHEAEQRDRERQMSLRREVYLEAAAALTHANGLVGRITSVDIDQRLLAEELAVDLSKLAKVHIVGSPETVQAIMNYVNELGPSFIELMAMRSPLVIRKSAIDLQQTLFDSALAEQNRITAMMQQLNIDGVIDPARWERLRDQHRIAAEDCVRHSTRQSELWREQLADMSALGEHLFARIEKLVRLLPAAILAVRSEMENPLDADWYKALWSEQTANMKVATSKLIESLRQSTGTSRDGDG
jgi:hypothetical protein